MFEFVLRLVNMNVAAAARRTRALRAAAIAAAAGERPTPPKGSDRE